MEFGAWLPPPQRGRCSAARARKPRARRSRSAADAHEVDEAALDVCVDELDAHAIAHVEVLEAAHDLAFGRRAQDPNPRALLRSAGDDAVEALAAAIGEQQRFG